MKKQEIMNYRMEIERLYDLYLMKTEKRGISYGEIAYIQSLSKKELDNLYKELTEKEEQ